MDQELISKYSSHLERLSWVLVFLGMLTQISAEISFPSYNIALGFWGAYCSFSKHGRATFGFILLTFLSLIVDIVFCSIQQNDSTSFQFSLVIFIICMFNKVFAVYTASHFFASIGGAYSMESNMNGSQFDSLGVSSDGGIVSGGYFPPDNQRD